MEKLTIEALKEVFWCDFSTGALYRQGIPVESRSTGYRYVTWEGVNYKVSHIVWALYYGRWPTGIVDHKDRNPQNDAIHNLREVTIAQNAWNSSKRCNSRAPHKGVRKVAGKYVAYINTRGTYTELGRFDLLQDAIDARLAAERERWEKSCF